MRLDTDALKLAIVGLLDRRETATPTEIALELGGLSSPGASAGLRQLLRRMVNNHLLVNDRRGVYRLGPTYGIRGLTVLHKTSLDIREVLRNAGGIAKTSRIHKALWDRPRGGKDRPYDHRRITQVLKSSSWFQQEYGRGYWNLDRGERATLPLLGIWASYDIQMATPADERAVLPDWREERAAHFERVGRAFAEARGDLGVDDVLADAAIHDALAVMALKAPDARSEAHQRIRATAIAEAAASGRSQDLRFVESLARTHRADLVRWLYVMFEEGCVPLHLSAPIEFYRSCAARFNVCAARLSRGRIWSVIGTEPVFAGRSVGSSETHSNTTERD